MCKSTGNSDFKTIIFLRFYRHTLDSYQQCFKIIDKIVEESHVTPGNWFYVVDNWFKVVKTWEHGDKSNDVSHKFSH